MYLERGNHATKQGWTTKQVEEFIRKKSGIKYPHIHITVLFRRLGFKQKVPKKVHVNTASMEEKDNFKKVTQIPDIVDKQ
jgi:putative transposase